MGRPRTSWQMIHSHCVNNGDGCWRWQGLTDKDGYGITSVGGIKMPVHRACYFLFYNVPFTSDYVLHKCNTRNCCNPHHLYLGNQKQNVQDQIDSGTFVYGSKNGMAKLTEEQVIKIRGSSLSNRDLATQLNVSYHTIWDARNRRWKQVK